MFAQDKKKNPRNMVMFLDILHIAVGAVIVILAVISFLNPEDHMVMFPAIFLLGAILNLTTGVCNIKGGNREKRARRAGYTQISVGVLLVMISIISAVSIWG